MRYADEATVYRRLAINPITNTDAALEATNVEAAIAEAIDGMIGRTYASGNVAETRDIYYDITPSEYFWSYPAPSYIDVLPLLNTSSRLSAYIPQFGFRDVIAVSVDGSWNGTAWTDATVLTPDQWRAIREDGDGWYHTLILGLTASYSVRVTATWEDNPGTTVPVDIREIANDLTIDAYRIRAQSPAGEIGPPGLATYLRDMWEFPMVKATLKRHKLHKLVV